MRKTSAILLISALGISAQESAKPNLVFSGDVRARGEWSYMETNDTTGKGIGNSNYPNNEIYDQMLRARLGVTFSQDFWSAGLRLVTGAGSPISANTVADNDFASKPVYLDQAYVGFKQGFGDANALSGSGSLQFGKIPGAFLKGFDGKSELIFGNDVNPEGGLFSVNVGSKDWRLSANVGRYWADEVDLERLGGQTYPDVFLQTEQLRFDLGSGNYRLRIGGAAHYYNDMLGHGALGLDSTKIAGNTSAMRDAFSGDKAKSYTTNFNLGEAYMDIYLDFADGQFPVTLSGNYVRNVEDDSSNTNQGFLVGAKLGRAVKAGQMEISGSYRYSGANSAVSYTSSPDYGFGNTNSRATILAIKYLLTNNLSVDLYGFLGQKVGLRSVDSSKSFTANKLRAELNASF